MTSRQRRILSTLAIAEGEMYGLDLVAAGVVRRIVLYVVLARMEDLGLISGREDSSTPPRRLYQITAVGRAALRSVGL